MIRSGRLMFLLTLAVLVPAGVSAQKDSKYTKDATKHLGLAMAAPTPTMKEDNYRKALVILREGMVQDAANAKVWLMSGTVLAALGEMTEADAAFRKAVELHADYAGDVASEREAAWVEAFNVGIQAMDAQKIPEAIKAMENAQVIYKERPEALMNLGALYANSGDMEKAEKAFADAIVATNSSVFGTLDDAGKAEWVRYRALAKLNVAQMYGAAGVASFTALDYDKARAQFKRAAEQNPYSRDFWFNHAQALWALSDKLEEERKAKPEAEQAALKAQLTPLYAEIEQLAKKTMEFDPNGEVLYQIEAQSHKRRGELLTDEAAKAAFQAATLKALEAHAALKVALDEVQIAVTEAGSSIRGKLMNMKATAGEDVNITFTVLDIDGKTMTTQKVTVKAPAAGETASFEAPLTVTGEIAGWKYVVQ